MVKVTKSPNMMSTTGRNPVMAAPTASPVKPASEIGVSSTRSLPNSSNRPERTLKGVPASATSSPMMQTVESRRISSASASRIACAKVSSRSFCAPTTVSGIHILVHFTGIRIGRCYCEFDCLLHFRLEFFLHSLQRRLVGKILFEQPFSQIDDRIPLRLPGVLFLLGAVVFAVDIANVVAVITVSIAEQKRRAAAIAGTIDQSLRRLVDGADVLSVNAHGFQAECLRSHQNVAGGAFRVVRIFRVEIIFANINHRKLEQLREVHLFVEHALSERAFSEKTNRDSAVAKALR